MGRGGEIAKVETFFVVGSGDVLVSEGQRGEGSRAGHCGGILEDAIICNIRALQDNMKRRGCGDNVRGRKARAGRAF